MDTSESYIKMCDCPDIQDKWRSASMKSEEGLRWVDSPSNKHTRIWLPRQDQIQEMMNMNLWEMVDRFRDFMCGYVTSVKYDFKTDYGNSGGASLEKYWLTFYMHEKHGKVWDGEKWVKRD